MGIKKTGKKYHYQFERYGKRYHGLCRLKDDDGDFTIPAKNMEEARLSVTQLQNDIDEKQKQLVNGKKILMLSDVIEMFDRLVSKSDLSTKVTSLRYTRRFLKLIGNRNFDTYNKLDIAEYRRIRLKTPIEKETKYGIKITDQLPKCTTINREVNSIRGLFTWARKEAELTERNPFFELNILRAENVEKPPLNSAQEEGMLNIARGNFMFPIIFFFMETGMRREEVLSCIWENVHLESSEIYKYGYIDVLKTKSGNPRRIPCSKELQEVLIAHKREQKINGLHYKYVFVNPKTNKRYNNLRKALNAIFDKVGIKFKGRGFHLFRHTFATDLEQRGYDITTIQALMGHKKVTTTQNYLHKDAKRMAIAVKERGKRLRKFAQDYKKSIEEQFKAA